jgi:hypothetical protein
MVCWSRIFHRRLSKCSAENIYLTLSVWFLSNPWDGIRVAYVFLNLLSQYLNNWLHIRLSIKVIIMCTFLHSSFICYPYCSEMLQTANTYTNRSKSDFSEDNQFPDFPVVSNRNIRACSCWTHVWHRCLAPMGCLTKFQAGYSYILFQSSEFWLSRDTTSKLGCLVNKFKFWLTLI